VFSSSISRAIKIKSDVMGQACSTCGGEEKCNPAFIGDSERKDRWKIPGVGESVIFKWILRE
jgi:hypothetical protein